jgi:predicted dehydrogenase
MGRNHARVLASMPDIDFVGIVEPAGVPFLPYNVPVFDNLQDLLSQTDAVVVATPTGTHEDIVLQCADAGVHVLVEKPVALTVESGERMANALDGLVGAVGHIERFNPAIRQLKSRLLQGDIGRVFQVATRRQNGYPNRIVDVGVVLDLASHDFDLTAWILDSSYNQVFGLVRSESGRDDVMLASGVMSDGVLVNHVVNWLSPIKERIVTVTGQHGTFVANTVLGDLTLYRNAVEPVGWDSVANFRGVSEGDAVRFAYPKKEPLVAELEGFLDAVRGVGSEFVSVRDGVQVLRVAEAVLQSAATGMPVKVGVL